MRIKAVEKTLWGFRGKQKQVVYRDEEAARTYSRIIAGFGWPFGGRPGAVITVGEELKADHSLPHSPHHLHIISETFSSDTEELYRACLRSKDHFFTQRFYGAPQNSLSRLWSRLGVEGRRVYITKAPDLETIDLNFVTQLVRKHTATRKTLHFDGSTLPQLLPTISQEDTERKNVEHYPGVAALGYVLSVMERPLSSGQYVPKRIRKPRVIRR